nr:hypothetical protein [Bradyrhizobium sp. 41S5]
MALNHDVAGINTIIDPMPRDGIFGLLRQQRPRRRVRSRVSWQWSVVVIESTSMHSPKHVRWQYERIGNGENPIHRLSLQKEESSSTLATDGMFERTAQSRNTPPAHNAAPMTWPISIASCAHLIASVPLPTMTVGEIDRASGGLF